MNRWWLAAALLAVVGPVNATDLSLERIMLSSGGVGYFEYEAVVDGNATLSLDVPLDQVDDILKSLAARCAGQWLYCRPPVRQSLRPRSHLLAWAQANCTAGIPS